MRIIKQSYLRAQAAKYPKATRYLADWVRVVASAEWKNFAELRHSYPSADLVAVASGRPVVVFNVCGNSYRLIAAVHFNSRRVYTLRFLTHADYSKNTWKHQL